MVRAGVAMNLHVFQPSRVHRSPRTPAQPRRLALLATAIVLSAAACSGDPEIPKDETNDATVDAAVDAAVAADTAVADNGVSFPDTLGTDTGEDECPGGPGCPCATNNQCDTALCIEAPTGKQCARHCVDECPGDFACQPVKGPGGDTITICVPKFNRLCNPCQATKDCAAIGLDGSSCVDHGNAGAFCGVKCTGDVQCPADYTCADVKTVEGSDTKQCVPKADASSGGAIGTCTCSKLASDLKLATSCIAEKLEDGKKLVCKGVRACGKDGLGACTAADPKPEACDGEDNDCDGKIDEGSCDDGNPCTSEVCAGAKGCASQDLDGIPCDDGNACTDKDGCAKGICIPGAAKNCDDKNPCTKDSCDMAKGCTQTADDNKPCSDDNPCTLGDTCAKQVCQPGKNKPCATAKACLVASCSLVDGKCKFTNATTGKSCSDDDACTKDDGCDGGVCLGKKVTCDDNDACTDDYCDGKKGCNSKPNTAGCEDGNPCTAGDKCAAGVCKPGKPKPCDDGNPCTSDQCDPKTGGCKGDGAPLNGKACDADNSACTANDACNNGKCTVGKAKKCDDGNTCTEDLCDAAKGCITKPKYAGACDADGTKCTENDSCKAGVCKAGPKKVCDDKNPCTKGTCNPDSGKCFYLPLANGTPCGPNGAKCKVATCIEGCKPKVEKKCHTGDVWWFDSCNKATEVATKCGTGFCVAPGCVKANYNGKFYVTASPSQQNVPGLGVVKFAPLVMTVTDWGTNLLQGDVSIGGQKISFTGKLVGKTWTAKTTFLQKGGILPITHKMTLTAFFKVDPAKTAKAKPDMFTGTILDTLSASGFNLGTVVWKVTGKRQ